MDPFPCHGGNASSGVWRPAPPDWHLPVHAGQHGWNPPSIRRSTCMAMAIRFWKYNYRYKLLFDAGVRLFRDADVEMPGCVQFTPTERVQAWQALEQPLLKQCQMNHSPRVICISKDFRHGLCKPRSLCAQPGAAAFRSRSQGPCARESWPPRTQTSCGRHTPLPNTRPLQSRIFIPNRACIVFLEF
jgi:hypothetical protein